MLRRPLSDAALPCRDAPLISTRHRAVSHADPRTRVARHVPPAALLGHTANRFHHTRVSNPVRQVAALVVGQTTSAAQRLSFALELRAVHCARWPPYSPAAIPFDALAGPLMCAPVAASRTCVPVAQSH